MDSQHGARNLSRMRAGRPVQAFRRLVIERTFGRYRAHGMASIENVNHEVSEPSPVISAEFVLFVRCKTKQFGIVAPNEGC